jgi:hypothetical protein
MIIDSDEEDVLDQKHYLKLNKCLGEGSFGKVYQAIDEMNNN